MNTIQMVNLFNATKGSSASVAECIACVVLGVVIGLVVIGIMELIDR